MPLECHRSDPTSLLDVLGGEVSIGHCFTCGRDNPDIERVPIGLHPKTVTMLRSGTSRMAQTCTNDPC